MSSFKLQGLCSAPVTPFDANGELNLSIISQYVDFLQTQGVHSVYLNGYTGEGVSMNVEERKLVAEQWVNEGRDKLDKIIVQVGGTNMKDSQQLAIHASKIGASAIACLPPLLYPSEVGSVVQYCRQIASTVPHLPFLYYHFPAATHVDIKVSDFLQAACDEIPNLVGVKYTHTDILDMSKCLMVADGRFTIALGVDDSLLPALSMGVSCAIGSTYSYSGKLNNAILKAFNEGDLVRARELQYKAHNLIKILHKYRTNIATAKAIHQICGVDVGPPRLPMVALDEGDKADLLKDLKDCPGFFGA